MSTRTEPADWGTLPWLHYGVAPCPEGRAHVWEEQYSPPDHSGYGHVWQCRACGRRVRVDSSD